MKSGSESPSPSSLGSALRSLKLTLVTLFMLAGSSVIGTLLPQHLPLADYQQRFGAFAARLIYGLQFDDMYHSWWFMCLLGLFAVNLTACSLHRLPGVWRQVVAPDPTPPGPWLKKRAQYREWREAGTPEIVEQRLAGHLRRGFARARRNERDGTVWLFAQRHPWARLGAYVTHLSILIIFLGAVVGGLGGFRGYVTIAEGQSVDHVTLPGEQAARPLDFSLRCDRFTVDYYPDSQRPRDFRSLLTVLEDGREVPGQVRVPVRVNHPFQYGGLTFFQSDYGLDAHLFRFSVTPRDGGEPFELLVPSNQHAVMPDGTSVAVMGYVPDFEGQGPVAGLQLFLPDGRREGAMAFQSPDVKASRIHAPAMHAGMQDPSYGFRLMSIDQRWYTGLQVSRDPGVPLVWLGCLLLVAGTLAAFYFSHQRLWIQLQVEGGGTRVRFAGHAHRHQDVFARRFESLCRELQPETAEDKS